MGQHDADKDQLGDISGMHAVVIGRSNIVGKPMAQLLLAPTRPSLLPTAAPKTSKRFAAPLTFWLLPSVGQKW